MSEEYLTGVIVDIIPLRQSKKRSFDVEISIRLESGKVIEATCGRIDVYDRRNLIQFPEEFLNKREATVHRYKLSDGTRIQSVYKLQ